MLKLAPDQVAAPARERAWIFGLLIGPSAVVANGVVQGGVLGYLLSLEGVGSGMQSHVIGLLSLPTSLYFLWSPITDFFVSRRTWLLSSAALAAVLMLAGLEQPQLSLRSALVLLFLSMCCGSLVGSSAGGIMGGLRSERTRRMAASFYQAGNLGFGALSAWVLIYLSSRVSREALGLIAAALICTPALAALASPRQPEISHGTFRATMFRVRSEFKATFLRWDALPYVACMTFPISTGAAIGLLPGVASQYGVSGDHVAWVNGLLGGGLIAAGSGVVSLIRSRMRAPMLYSIVGLVNCACFTVLWLGPMRASTYFIGVPLYLFTVGSGYAMYTAVVLEFLGESGRSGSARYSIINSLGNIPVLYMLQVDGWGGDHWGAPGLAAAEVVAGAAGALVLLALFFFRAPARTSIPSEQPLVAE